MKIIFTVFLLIICTGLKSQLLNVQLLHEISDVSYDSVSDIMTGKYGFERLKELEENNELVFLKGDLEDQRMVIITILPKNSSCRNAASIVAGVKLDIEKFKNEIIHNGFRYTGENVLSGDITMHSYIKGKSGILISDQPTQIGAYQIIFDCGTEKK